MNDGLKLNDYNWAAIQSPGDAPLIITSRALELAQICLQHPREVTDSVPDSEFYRLTDDEIDLTEITLVIGALGPRRIDMSCTNDGEISLATKWRKQQYKVSTEKMWAGPEPIKLVDFERTGQGRCYRRMYCEDFVYDMQDILMCWKIADIAMQSMKDLDYYLKMGTWPKL